MSASSFSFAASAFSLSKSFSGSAMVLTVFLSSRNKWDGDGLGASQALRRAEKPRFRPTQSLTALLFSDFHMRVRRRVYNS